MQNDGSGANTKADLDFHAANTKYATISGGYGASAPELDIKVGNTPSKIVTFTDGGDVSFYEDTGTTPKMFWDASAESLGIGTSSPISLLQLLGSPVATSGALATFRNADATSSNTSFGGVLFNSSPGTDYSIGKSNVNSVTTLSFRNANTGASYMDIDSSGNVGIGTTSAYGTNVLNVNGGIAIDGRNASTPGLCEKGDVDTGIFWPAANSLSVTTGGTERFNIDSSGNVTVKAAGELRIRDDGTFIKEDQGLQIGNTSGTGTTRPIRFFTESAERMRIDSGGGINKVAGSGATLPAIAAGLLTGEFKGSADSAVTNDSGFLRLSAGGGTTVGVKAGIDIFRGATDGSLIRMFTNGSEALRLDSSRNLLVGSTNNSNETDEGFKLKPNGEGTNKPRLSISTAGYQTETCLSIYSTAVTAFRFYVDAAGTISAVNTSITSISDERVKENVRDLDDGLDKVLQLQPRKFDWKQGQGRDISNDRGFIAQEFEQVFPDMIEEWKDKAPEGEEPYKAINANLIPTLVKAIQEQQETITALEARISQLEND